MKRVVALRTPTLPLSARRRPDEPVAASRSWSWARGRRTRCVVEAGTLVPVLVPV